MTSESDLKRGAAVRIALVALVLCAIGLAAGPAQAEAQEPADGIQFALDCKQTGATPDGGSIGPITCTLKVTGLPAPLEGEVVLTFSSGDDPGDDPNDPSPNDTSVSHEAPAIAPGDPALVSRRLPLAPPPPPPAECHVPEQPPKAL